MKQELIGKGYVPLDKSWIIRMGVLDLVHGKNDAAEFLKQHQDELGDDLLALQDAIECWNSNKPVDVGESGTLYRFLKFASWKLDINKKFMTSGTLSNRAICDDPTIIHWPLESLLKLDNKTSQWASASVLLGNEEKIANLMNLPYKLQVTYDAVNHWNDARNKGSVWEPRYDKTILAQAIAYLTWARGSNAYFRPEQAEDYCFARAFDLMTSERGGDKWPSLKGHESNRLVEMEEALKQDELISLDHRVVQAVAMRKKGKIKVKHPECVKKSWPQFWRFIDYSKTNSN